MKKILAMLLSLCLMLGLCPALAEDSLAGTYVLDASPLGMPLQVYLIIDENQNFQWLNKLEGGTDKGQGMIGNEDGVYMMLYSDSTAEQMKTATFTVEGQSLVFSTNVPYGSASLAPNTSDPENVIYPVAKKMVNMDVLGLYVGQVEASAMGAAILYECELELALGGEYTLISRFSMMGGDYEYVQEGTFTLENGALTFVSGDLAGQQGQLSGDEITADFFLSAMASSPRTAVLKKATTAEAAGVYTGVKDMSMMGFVANATLTLDAVGGYTYTSAIDGEDYTEKGSFTYENGAVKLLSDAEGAAEAEGTLANEVLVIKLRIAESVPMATEITFYSEKIQGEFTCEGEDAAGNTVKSVLTLNADGTYAISVNDGAYTEAGAFAVAASPMGVSITLTSANGVESTGMVSDTININHNIDSAFNTLGFKYEK